VHAVKEEFRTDSGFMFRTVCHMDAFSRRGYHPVEGLLADCANCRRILEKAAHTGTTMRKKDCVYLLVDEECNSITEADSLDELLDTLSIEYSDQEILDELSDSNDWRIFRAQRINIVPVTEKIVKITELREED
jgi:hypothetical protein